MERLNDSLQSSARSPKGIKNFRIVGQSGKTTIGSPSTSLHFGDDQQIKSIQNPILGEKKPVSISSPLKPVLKKPPSTLPQQSPVRHISHSPEADNSKYDQELKKITDANVDYPTVLIDKKPVVPEEMTLKQLKDQLKQRSLSQAGAKRELVGRLRSALMESKVSEILSNPGPNTDIMDSSSSSSDSDSDSDSDNDNPDQVHVNTTSSLSSSSSSSSSSPPSSSTDSKPKKTGFIFFSTEDEDNDMNVDKQEYEQDEEQDEHEQHEGLEDSEDDSIEDPYSQQLSFMDINIEKFGHSSTTTKTTDLIPVPSKKRKRSDEMPSDQPTESDRKAKRAKLNTDSTDIAYSDFIQSFNYISKQIDLNKEEYIRVTEQGKALRDQLESLVARFVTQQHNKDSTNNNNNYNFNNTPPKDNSTTTTSNNNTSNNNTSNNNNTHQDKINKPQSTEQPKQQPEINEPITHQKIPQSPPDQSKEENKTENKKNQQSPTEAKISHKEIGTKKGRNDVLPKIRPRRRRPSKNW